MAKEGHLNYKKRPVFRQESLYGTKAEDAGPWEKQLPSSGIPGRFIEERETVLGKTDDDFPDILYNSDSEGDHYDAINESEIRISTENEDDVRNSVPQLPSRRPKNSKIIRQFVLKDDKKHKAPKLVVEEHISTEAEKSRCLEFSEMVNIFKPLIVHNLLVHDILPHLPFLENHDDIYAAVKFRTPKDAVVSLLIELERSQELGKWQKFIDALSACGYTYIVDNIRGYKFICHKYQREYIKKLTPKLSKMILPVGLLPHLHAKDLISDSDKENILQEDMNHGHIAAAVVLLDRITRKHRNWYMLFIETLKDADMEDVAADLQIPELLEKNRTKVADTYSFDDNDLYTISPISSDQSKTCRPLSGLNVITEFATSDSKTEDHANYTSDEGYEVYDDTEYYSSPPPLLPPTIPMRPKRNVPFPDHCDLYSDQYSQRHLYNRKELNGTYFDGNDTMYEQYDDEIIDIEKSTSSFIAPGNDQQMRVNEENSRKAQNINVPEFQDLIDEIEKTKKKNNKIQLEISLLEMKYSVNEKLNCSLKRRRELRQEIEVKEREKEALESEKTCEEEESETDVNTDDYYPTDVAKCEPHSVHSLGAKRSFDYRPLSYLEEWAIPKSRVPPLQLDSEFQVVKLYSPAFEQKSTISHRFEQDSGIGADLSL